MNPITTQFVVGVSVADIRHDPDPNAELVTQALMNVSVQTGEVNGDWTYVTLSDYSGWIRTSELELPVVRGVCDGDEGACGVALPYVIVVSVPHTPLYASATGDEELGEVYLSTALPYIDLNHPQRIRVALPGEGEAWLERSAIEIRKNTELYPKQPIATVVAHAKSLLGRPYLWGGTSWRGIDCSGFVQLSYRMGGEIIPRDADQQHDFLPVSVTREDMCEGDLIFFGRERVTHVGMALNNQQYIHAAGRAHQQVMINSFDPQQPDYNADLAQVIRGIKRVRII